MKIVILSLCLLLFSACGPREEITYQSLRPKDEEGRDLLLLESKNDKSQSSLLLDESTDPVEDQNETEKPLESAESSEAFVAEETEAMIGKEFMVSEAINVRSEANGESEVLFVLVPGEAFTVIKVEGDWVKVQQYEMMGFTNKDILMELISPFSAIEEN